MSNDAFLISDAELYGCDNSALSCAAAQPKTLSFQSVRDSNTSALSCYAGGISYSNGDANGANGRNAYDVADNSRVVKWPEPYLYANFNVLDKVGLWKIAAGAMTSLVSVTFGCSNIPNSGFPNNYVTLVPLQ